MNHNMIDEFRLFECWTCYWYSTKKPEKGKCPRCGVIVMHSSNKSKIKLSQSTENITK